MILTGIVKEINVTASGSTLQNNLYAVDVGAFKTTANLNSKESIVECTASSAGGIYQEYNVGDPVYVDFVNDQANYPVIIGHIYKGLDNTNGGARSYANFKALQVVDNAQLPLNTTIGTVAFSELLARVYSTQQTEQTQGKTGEPAQYLKDASVNNNTLTILKSNNETITFSAAGSNVSDVKINGSSIVDSTTHIANIPTASGSTYGVIQGTTITNITNKIPSEATSSNKLADKAFVTSSIGSAISNITVLIPEQATSSNKLADKAFVNSSIATHTANFLGTFDVVSDLGLQYGATTAAIIAALNAKTFSSKTNNDYVFVINKDSDAHFIYQRFKWVSSSNTFLYEYSLNNSSFTANQWAAINSGITSSIVSDIASKTWVGQQGFLTSIPIGTASTVGGVKSSTTGTTAGRDYNVEIKADGTMKVNVPWEKGSGGTYSAGTGLSLSGSTFNHSNSVTAGTASEGGSTRTLAASGTFNIPSVTYDAQGHVTAKGSTTLTMPATYPPSSHTHDDRYYTESETDTLLNGKSNTGHTHSQYLTKERGASSFYLSTYSSSPSIGVTPVAGDVLFMPLSSSDSSLVTRVYTGSSWAIVYSVYN